LVLSDAEREERGAKLLIGALGGSVELAATLIAVEDGEELIDVELEGVDVVGGLELGASGVCGGWVEAETLVGALGGSVELAAAVTVV